MKKVRARVTVVSCKIPAPIEQRWTYHEQPSTPRGLDGKEARQFQRANGQLAHGAGLCLSTFGLNVPNAEVIMQQCDNTHKSQQWKYTPGTGAEFSAGESPLDCQVQAGNEQGQWCGTGYKKGPAYS